MVSVIDRSLDALKQRARSGAELAIDKEMAVVTQNVVVETVFGAKLELGEADRLTTALVEAFRQVNIRMFLFFLPAWLPLPGEKAFRSAILTLDESMSRLLSGRRASGERRKDLLSLLLDARDPDTGEAVSDRQLRDELITLFIAGNETTAITMTWAMYLLGRHPDIEAKVRAEVKEVLGDRLPNFEDLPRLRYTKMVIQEALRLYPTSWILPRLAAADDEVGGYQIPKGATVIVSQYIMHHHPSLWPNPEVFDPERFTPENLEGRPRHAFMPFGAGPRLCIGDQFAIMEAQFILAMMTQRFRARLAPGARGEHKAVTTLRPKSGMPMFLDPLV
jgi:cytochrome P450